MPSNHYVHVCIPCRNTVGYGLCQFCGAERIVKARWSAPTKNNDRAWKRIENGEWLWDRRRVRRNPQRMNFSRFTSPHDKPGQLRWLTAPISRKYGADVDMGG